jgi:hypothetical protein
MQNFPKLLVQHIFIGISGIFLESGIGPNVLKILVIDIHNNRSIANEIGKVQPFENRIPHDLCFTPSFNEDLTAFNLSFATIKRKHTMDKSAHY